MLEILDVDALGSKNLTHQITLLSESICHRELSESICHREFDVGTLHYRQLIACVQHCAFDATELRSTNDLLNYPLLSIVVDL